MWTSSLYPLFHLVLSPGGWFHMEKATCLRQAQSLPELVPSRRIMRHSRQWTISGRNLEDIHTDQTLSNHPTRKENSSPPGQLTELVVILQPEQLVVLHASEPRRMFITERACLKTTQQPRWRGKKGRSISSTEDKTDFSLTEDVLKDQKGVHFKHVHHFTHL